MGLDCQGPGSVCSIPNPFKDVYERLAYVLVTFYWTLVRSLSGVVSIPASDIVATA